MNPEESMIYQSVNFLREQIGQCFICRLAFLNKRQIKEHMKSYHKSFRSDTQLEQVLKDKISGLSQQINTKNLKKHIHYSKKFHLVLQKM